MSNRRQQMNRRTFLAGAAAASAVATTTPRVGAGPLNLDRLRSINYNLRQADPAKITWWSWYTEQEESFIALAEEFQEANPDITVEPRVYGNAEYLQVLESAVAGNEAPDIFAPHVHAIEYGKAGVTIDLNEALGEDFLKDFFQSTRDQFTEEGKQYAIGWMAQTFGMFYTPSLFEEAGVEEVPETWDDLITAAAKFNDAGIIPVAFNNSEKNLGADFWLPLVTQATDDPTLVLKLDAHEEEGVSWDSEPVIDALTKLDDIVKGNVFQEGTNGTSNDQATALFYSGRAAMFFNGSWFPQAIEQNGDDEFTNAYKIFPTPAWAPGARHWTANQAGAAFAVNANGNVDGALKFLEFIYEPDRYSRVMNENIAMPSTESAAQLVDSEIMQTMTSWLEDGCPHILFGTGSWDAVSNNLQDIFGQTKDPADVAAQMEADVQAARSRG